MRYKFWGNVQFIGRLCRNFGRKSRSLVSGPGIGVMSGIPKGSSGFWENLGRIRLYTSTKESRMSVRSAIRTTLSTSPDFGIDYKHHQVKVRSRVALSGVETDPIRGVGCTGVWGDT
ncbi:organic cation/carnitine transporter 3 [Prunus dulcis]|uniref:Organic cation/carnitine transporter 3 n=1 Tax=Prunus dulcis TaxID=3755 RepID=A0A4Y1RXA9_PRUDU|nr:organic cation/carnitine transporter 3 [Prunus dulcis]